MDPIQTAATTDDLGRINHACTADPSLDQADMHSTASLWDIHVSGLRQVYPISKKTQSDAALGTPLEEGIIVASGYTGSSFGYIIVILSLCVITVICMRPLLLAYRF